MTNLTKKLIDSFDMTTLDDNRYQANVPNMGWRRIFGGLVIAQGIIALYKTMKAERTLHALHANFIRPGDPEKPIIYEITNLRDGHSFSARSLFAIQGDRIILSMLASFQTRETGLEHQIEMPQVPMPDQLDSELELAKQSGNKLPENVRKFWESKRPIELKPTQLEHYLSNTPLPPQQNVWFRSRNPLPTQNQIQQAIMAYASDMTIIDTALFAHGKAIFDHDMVGASLDHAMWFHHPSDFSDWHLYAQDSPASAGGRGINRGAIYHHSGKLVATVSQEGLIRQRTR